MSTCSNSKQSERVHYLKNNFMKWHEEGFSISEIAENCKLSISTVYHYLGEIARENNVTRESLMKIVRTPSEKGYAREAAQFQISSESMEAEFRNINKSLGNLEQMMQNFLYQEMCDTVFKREEE